MHPLFEEVPEAKHWADQMRSTHSADRVFEKIVCTVIWTSAAGQDGKPLVELDPSTLAADIEENGFPLFAGHDPGAPLGRVVAARAFATPRGTIFVGAAIGIYGQSGVVTFKDLGVDSTAAADSPASLDALQAESVLNFAIDPSEVETQWVDELLEGAPLPVVRVELSHNAAEPQAELIRIGLVYLALVWNPFVTSVASEAGKGVYAGIHKWLRRLWDKLAERRNPIVALQSTQNGCQVDFLFRGKDVARNYAAHDTLPEAAAQAAKLIFSMKARGAPPRGVVYEFDPEARKWSPSYATLHDGRLVSDRNILVAFEQAPAEMSLGITRGSKKPPLPR